MLRRVNLTLIGVDTLRSHRRLGAAGERLASDTVVGTAGGTGPEEASDSPAGGRADTDRRGEGQSRAVQAAGDRSMVAKRAPDTERVTRRCSADAEELRAASTPVGCLQMKVATSRAAAAAVEASMKW